MMDRGLGCVIGNESSTEPKRTWKSPVKRHVSCIVDNVRSLEDKELSSEVVKESEAVNLELSSDFCTRLKGASDKPSRRTAA
jgi:hypothetical protein